jgi:adenine-specific DNA-methyltransferase
MTEEQRQLTDLKGNIDIYLAFILKCLELLEIGGRMVAIIPNSFIFTKSAEIIRQSLLENNLIEKIYNFESEKLFDVDIYTCIILFSKTNNTKKQIKYFTGFPNFIEQQLPISLQNTKINTLILGEKIKIYNGIATLRDKIFIHKIQLFNEPCWKPIFKVSKNEIKYIIFPYNDDGTIIEENEFKNKNLQTYNFLFQNKNELEKRDKGKKEYSAWYAFGRTQSLKISKEKEVLYISIIINKDFIIHKRQPTLFIAGLCIETNEMNLVVDIINKNREFILQNSTKRGDGWVNINTNIIKKITIT